MKAAKYEETQWRNGPSYLSSLYQSLLARAVAEEKLIPFGRMEPSLIKLETADEVQLGYAQAASAIEFIIARAGHEGLREIMKRMATKTEKAASESIKDIMGLAFEEFEKQWKEFLEAKRLKGTSGMHARRFKIKEGKADEERMDLEEIKSLVSRNRAHLADLLKERGRTEAAVLEYRRALAGNPESVSILNKLSSALMGMGQDGEALEFLTRAREVYPDHPTTYTYLGQVYLKLKDFRRAKEAFSESIQINPFNPEVHEGLAQACERLDEKERAAKEREIAGKLRR